MSFSENKPEIVKQNSLQIDEDISFFKKEVVFQRIGWIIMFLLLLFGCLGLFGTGLLSIKKDIKANAELQYEKYMRFENETALIFRLNDSHEETIIGIPESYLRNFQISTVMPQTSAIEIRDGVHYFHFHTSGASQISIFIKPRETGSVRANITLNNESFALSHFIYP